MDNLDNKKTPKIYTCEICDFKSVNFKDYKRHCDTLKHLRQEMDNKNPKNTPKNPKSTFICNYCQICYKYRSGLSRHLSKCKKIDTKSTHICSREKDKMLIDMLDKNKELHNIIVEQNKQISVLIPKIGNTTNNTFNLNMFLNEECKDAINWTEFINSIEFGLSNLHELTNTTITKSITSAVCNKINELGVYKRPIHCLDQKRRKLCIKNAEEWEKDDNKVKILINKSDKHLQHKYIKLIKEWEDIHPGWEDNDNLIEEYMILSHKVYEEIDVKHKIEILKEVYIPK